MAKERPTPRRYAAMKPTYVPKKSRSPSDNVGNRTEPTSSDDIETAGQHHLLKQTGQNQNPVSHVNTADDHSLPFENSNYKDNSLQENLSMTTETYKKKILHARKMNKFELKRARDRKAAAWHRRNPVTQTTPTHDDEHALRTAGPHDDLDAVPGSDSVEYDDDEVEQMGNNPGETCTVVIPLSDLKFMDDDEYEDSVEYDEPDVEQVANPGTWTIGVSTSDIEAMDVDVDRDGDGDTDAGDGDGTMGIRSAMLKLRISKPY